MTSGEKNPENKQKPLLLFSALDWGLGHTLRSVCLLRQWQAEGFDIIIACNSTQKQVLQQEISGCRYTHLAGYGIRYARSGRATRLMLVWQLPAILRRIRAEKRWLRAFFGKNRVALVVSDNRYGFSPPSGPSLFITHQLAVRTGFGKWLDRFVNRRLYRYMSKFSECWVPDDAKEGLAGALSHPAVKPPLATKYIGILSRFDELAVHPRRSLLRLLNDSANAPNAKSCSSANTAPAGVHSNDPLCTDNVWTDNTAELSANDDSNRASWQLLPVVSPELCKSGYTAEADINATDYQFAYCALISGPEPQRAIFEEMVAEAFAGIGEPCLMIRGKPGARPGKKYPANIMIVDFAAGPELKRLLGCSAMIVCRAGYSTIMDLLILRKKMLLVPTPGQGEQEYLAAYLQKKGIARMILQENFSAVALATLAR